MQKVLCVAWSWTHPKHTNVLGHDLNTQRWTVTNLFPKVAAWLVLLVAGWLTGWLLLPSSIESISSIRIYWIEIINSIFIESIESIEPLESIKWTVYANLRYEKHMSRNRLRPGACLPPARPLPGHCPCCRADARRLAHWRRASSMNILKFKRNSSENPTKFTIHIHFNEIP